MGHIDQQRSNVRSNQQQPASSPNEIEQTPDELLALRQDAAPPILDAPEQRPHYIYVDCQESTGQIYSEPAGRFLQPSTSGNTTVIVVYYYDSNYVHAEPMQSKTGPHILAAYKRAHKMLTATGLKPKLQNLDNEASKALQEFVQENAIDYQLAPPPPNSSTQRRRTRNMHVQKPLHCGDNQHRPQFST
jgi:hypothetical protein